MITITGIVKDTDGIPLEGVNIFLFDDDSIGTTTNALGVFSLEVNSYNELVIFSYQDTEVLLEASKAKEGVVIDTVNVLDEIEVVGKLKNLWPLAALATLLIIGTAVVILNSEEPKKVVL